MIARKHPPGAPAEGEPIRPASSANPPPLAPGPASRRGVLLVIGILVFGAAFAALGYALVRTVVARRKAVGGKRVPAGDAPAAAPEGAGRKGGA